VSPLSTSPAVRKGAILALAPGSPAPRVVAVFQYNPFEVTRDLKPNTGKEGGSLGEQLRLSGPPTETITLSIEIDAVDQLAAGDATAAQYGVSPSLAGLELLLYPQSSTAISDAALGAEGMLEVVPEEAPLALLSWNANRILPVRIESLTIDEQAFDANLNPIQATVKLSLRVLNYHDLGTASDGGKVFLAQQKRLEQLAGLSGAGGVVRLP
jgi:hypothetical protein